MHPPVYIYLVKNFANIAILNTVVWSVVVSSSHRRVWHAEV
jgi:hypothetical protein